MRDIDHSFELNFAKAKNKAYIKAKIHVAEFDKNNQEQVTQAKEADEKRASRVSLLKEGITGIKSSIVKDKEPIQKPNLAPA